MSRAGLTTLLAAVALTLALTAAPAALAAHPPSLPDVEDEVMCVTCNVPLNVAESPQAEAQKAQIRRLIDRGLTKDQIKDRLVAEYGRNVLALPDDDGIGLAAYLVPAAVAALMIAVLALLVPRWRRRPREAAFGTSAPALSPADERRLDEDLARYDP